MSTFIEARLALLPADAGGRTGSIAPRDGSYRPFVRFDTGVGTARLRVIEGPPLLGPGDDAHVVAEVEDEIEVVVGSDGLVVELGARVVGLLTVVSVCRGRTR